MNNWQPIKDAPKDGTDVLVWYRDAMFIAYWMGTYWSTYCHSTLDPTHWMPLPEPPKMKIWLPAKAWKAAAPNVSKKLQIAKSKKKRVVSRAKATATKGKA